jgi:ABC-type sugar transport system substrate-binding protein
MTGWSCSIVTPPTTVEDLAAWQESQLREAVISRADAIVLENRSTFTALQNTIRQAREIGIYVAVMGDSPGDPSARLNSLPGGIASTFMSTDPALGGWTAGGLVIGFLADYENSAAMVIVRSAPAANRPRAAYCALAVAQAGVRGRCEFVSVDSDFGSLTEVVDLAAGLLAKNDAPLGIACVTDRQLMALARELRDKLPIALCERIHLIGYDGAIDSNGDFLIANSPIRVYGTVDTRAHDQGRIIADEILSVAAGLEPREYLTSAPTPVRLLCAAAAADTAGGHAAASGNRVAGPGQRGFYPEPRHYDQTGSYPAVCQRERRPYLDG